jgi:hypothetical protein
MRRALFIAASTLAVATAAAAPAAAQTSPQRIDLSRLSDGELNQRLGFLEERLDRERSGAWWHHWGWTGFYVAATAYSIGVAVGDDSGNHKDRNTGIVNAVQSAGGVAYMLLSPHPARNGADPMREIAGTTRADRERRLAVGEEVLMRSADRAEQPYRFLPHALTVGINLAAGGIIWAVADRTHAIRSTVAGIAIGEARLWTMPSLGRIDLADYNARFGGATTQQRAGFGAAEKSAMGVAFKVPF